MRIGRWFIAKDADGQWVIGKEDAADKNGDGGGEKVGVLFVCLGSTRSAGRAP